jgi:hypothetical protein
MASITEHLGMLANMQEHRVLLASVRNTGDSYGTCRNMRSCWKQGAMLEIVGECAVTKVLLGSKEAS